MRRARAEDHWRRVATKDRGFGLTTIRLSGKTPLADADLLLAPGMTVLCGLNGVGKSTLLRIIEATLNGVDRVQGRCRDELLKAGEADIALISDGASVLASLGKEPPSNHRAVVLDAFEVCAQAMLLVRQANFSDLLEGVEPRTWSDDERSLASYVVGRTFDEVDSFEVELPSSLEEGFAEQTIPYFRVLAGGVRYDTSSMGLGELAALMCLWRLGEAEAQTVLILEEPETFLSSRSTVALLDVLAKVVEERRMYALVTTHSPEVIARVPIEHLRLLQPTAGAAATLVTSPSNRAELEAALGAYVGQARLAITEDRVARIIVRELLSQLRGLWGQSVDVREAGDVSTVVSLCAKLPRFASMNIVGVLDGDQVDSAPVESTWPVVVLPIPGDPNRTLRESAETSVAGLAGFAGRDLPTVTRALQSVAGLDHHDWFPELAAELGLEEAAVIRAALSCWMSAEGNAAAADAFVAKLEGALVGGPSSTSS